MPVFEALLATDHHLKATCLDAYRLAWAIETLLLDSLVHAPELEEGGSRIDDIILEDIVGRLFEADYRRRAYLRLYNVVIDEPPVDIGAPGTRVEVLARADIPGITGEVTAFSTLHREGTGDTFIIFEDQSFEDDLAWWTKCWNDAIQLVNVLKYVKYGIVDLDYGALRYEPVWVNEVRRYGVGIGGRPRFDIQPEPYRVTPLDEQKLRLYLSAVAKHQAVLADMSSSLRKAIGTAGDYYEGHHSRTKSTDQLIDLVISLEALFGPRDQQELAYRVSMATAVLLGSSTDEIANLFVFLRRMYEARSRIVHGGESPFETNSPKRRVTREDVGRLGDCVRQAILRLAVLLARGDCERNRDRLLSNLARASFDHELRTTLRERSDVDAFLGES